MSSVDKAESLSSDYVSLDTVGREKRAGLETQRLL
jgi:hypothetical protein